MRVSDGVYVVLRRGIAVYPFGHLGELGEDFAIMGEREAALVPDQELGLAERERGLG